MTEPGEHKLHIICGRPGVGKSHYGRRFAKMLGATLVDIDTCTETIVRQALTLVNHDPNDRDSAFFKSHFREVIYEQLFAIARENLQHNTVIIAAPFTKELNNKNWVEELQAALRVEVEITYLDCHEAIRLERIKQRANPRDLAKLNEWQQHQDYYADAPRPAFPHKLMDTSKTD